MRIKQQINPLIQKSTSVSYEPIEISEDKALDKPIIHTKEQEKIEFENQQFQQESEKHLIQKQSAVSPILKENTFPSLLDILTEGKKKSSTFASLMKANNIDLTNFTDVIFFGTGTYTETESGIIRISMDQNIKFQVIKLTHELTNRKNLATLKQISKDVREGTITPEKYADKLAVVEYDGEINQVKVAADIGYRYEGKGSESLNKLIDEYAKDKSIDLTKKLKPNPDKHAFYEQQGQKLREQYLEKHK